MPQEMQKNLGNIELTHLIYARYKKFLCLQKDLAGAVKGKKIK